MAEYTPTTEQMLDMYAGHVCSDGKRRIVATRRKEFYGWLAQHVEQDERIQAWEAIAAHAAFADCYQEERPLLESVIDRIDALVSTEEAVVELSPSSLQAEIDRLNAILRTTEVGEASCGHTNAMCSKHGDPWPCVTPEASCVSECCDCHATLEEGEQDK